MLEQPVQIINKLGLHARAATKFANLAKRFSCSITVVYDGRQIDGKSIMSLMLLAAAKGAEITLKTEGQDERKAMSELTELINNRFDEEA